MPTPDRELARELLERHWSDVVQGRTTCGIDESTVERINVLIGSETVTFTYSLPTQLLGKLTDHRLDALCLQRGDNSESQWDPRSFAAGVVVPWVRDTENVLGNSADPYVSNPLRQPRIRPDPPNVKPTTLPLWASLHDVLSEVQTRNDPAYTEDVFRSVLRAIFERLGNQQFDYPTQRSDRSPLHRAGIQAPRHQRDQPPTTLDVESRCQSASPPHRGLGKHPNELRGRRRPPRLHR